MVRAVPTRLARWRVIRRTITVILALLIFVVGLSTAILYTLRDSRRRTQIQTDPQVATVWVLGVTHGSNQTLQRGTILQRWLNAHNIHAFGDYSALPSGYSGNPGGVEIWFDYVSHLATPQLECHRLGETAFVDDLGQPYHGYLDIHGKIVGVYLPGYDHAAHHLLCALHWMPRSPNLPFPVSMPMVFSIDLPPTPRVLPPASSLPRQSVSVTRQSITVTASEARLSKADLTPRGGSQRDLTFRLKIQGGELADSNLSSTPPLLLASNGINSLFSSSQAQVYTGNMRRSYPFRSRRAWRWSSFPYPGNLPNSVPMPTSGPLFSLTDPYGIPLLPNGGVLTPMLSQETLRGQANGTVWIAPVNGAGHGTDVVRLHFDVRPTRSAAHTGQSRTPVPFDLDIPVQTGDEI